MTKTRPASRLLSSSYNQVCALVFSCRVVSYTDILLVIQGTADAEQTDRTIQEKAASSVDFALSVIHKSSPEEQKAVLEKVRKAAHEPEELEKLTPGELAVLQGLREKQLKFIKGEENLANFAHDAIEGFTPNLVTGSLGLTRIKSEAMNGNGNKEPGVIGLLEMADSM